MPVPNRFRFQEKSGKVNHYKTIKVLGTGSFGACVEIENEENLNKYACKVIDIVNGIVDLSEMKILKKVQHENVVTLYKVYKSPKVILAVQELCISSLETVLSSIKTMSMHQYKYVGAQLLCGLDYIHGKNVIHRDIKPANILVTEGNIIKICDFGLAYDYDYPSPHSAIDEECGTPGYIPPEVDKGSNWCTQSDIWAFGVVLLDMVVGIKRNRRHQAFTVPYPVPQKLAMVINHIFVDSPNVRPTAKKCLAYNFFQNPLPCDILVKKIDNLSRNSEKD